LKEETLMTFSFLNRKIQTAMIILLLIGMVLSMLTFTQKQSINTYHNTLTTSIQLSESLRQLSNDLERLARCYIITIDQEVETSYYQTLKKVKNFQTSEYQPVIENLSLELKNRFDNMVAYVLDKSHIEIRAMNAVKGMFLDDNGQYSQHGKSDWKMARRLLFEEDFETAREQTMTSIDTFKTDVMSQQQSAIDTSNTKSFILFFLGLLCQICIFLGIIVYFSSQNNYLLTPLNHILDYIALSKGQSMTSNETNITKKINQLESYIQELMASQKELYDMLDLIPFPVIETDRQSKIKYMNKTGSEAIGYSTADYVGKSKENYFKVIEDNTEPKRNGKQLVHMQIGSHDPRPVIIYSSSVESQGKMIGKLDVIVDQSYIQTLVKDFIQDSDHLKASIQAMTESVKHMQNNIEGMKKQAESAVSNTNQISSSIGTVASASEQSSRSISNIAAMTEQMSSTFQNLVKMAQKTAGNVRSMADSGEKMSKNVNNVAAAIEQMSASLGEVAKNTSEASLISKDANAQTSEINSKMETLVSASKQIGKVIAVIKDIADQTNMLALNAAIEAAGACEAGKGFAVVAGEVKELAKQSADATDEIASQIEHIQNSTHDVVEAMETVNTIINQISAINETIAAAVSQQTTAASEVAVTIAETAHGTDNVAVSATESAQLVKEIASSTEEVAKTASDVTRNIGELDSGSKDIAQSSSNAAQRIKQIMDDVQTFKQKVSEAENDAKIVSQSVDKLTNVSHNMNQRLAKLAN